MMIVVSVRGVNFNAEQTEKMHAEKMQERIVVLPRLVSLRNIPNCDCKSKDIRLKLNQTLPESYLNCHSFFYCELLCDSRRLFFALLRAPRHEASTKMAGVSG
jgi:hypothetical protein